MSYTPDLARPARELAQQGLDAYQVATHLFDPNAPIRSCHALARGLYFPWGLNLSSSVVAKVLHHEKGLRLSLETVANVLSSRFGLNLPAFRVAKVLHVEEGLGLSLETVAQVLHHKEGLGLSLETVAKALSSPLGLNLSWFRVAQVLHHEKGLGLSIEKVVQVLHHKDGANLSPARVAIALTYDHGRALPPHKLVPALATITASDEALFEATVPLVRSSYHRPEDRLALMDALLYHLPTERSLPLLAKAMLAGEPPLYSPETLARLLAAEDGLELPRQSVVYALTHHDGPRLTLGEVARILIADTGLALAPHAAAEALACGAALNHHEARRIVGDGMDSDQVPVLQRDEDEPKLARAVSKTPLVR